MEREHHPIFSSPRHRCGIENSLDNNEIFPGAHLSRKPVTRKFRYGTARFSPPSTAGWTQYSAYLLGNAQDMMRTCAGQRTWPAGLLQKKKHHQPLPLKTKPPWLFACLLAGYSQHRFLSVRLSAACTEEPGQDEDTVCSLSSATAFPMNST